MSETRSWYEVRNASGVTDISIYDEIGMFGVSASAFVGALNSVKTPTINLYVNSPGGSVDDGIAIYNALQRHKATVNATVDGLAASIASVIVQACDTRTMGAGSTMMVHEPHGLAMGDAATMAKMAEELNVYGDNIAEIYASKAGGTSEDWRATMRDEVWYKADQAVAAGLADAVIVPKGVKNSLQGRVFNLAKYQNVPEWVPQAVNEPDPDPIPAPTPISPVTRAELRRWPLLPHHTDSGALDNGRLAIALQRAYDLNIPISERDQAISHLRSHQSVA